MSDVLVPDLFISNYLPRLSGEAVRVYLYSLRMARTRETLSSSELLSFLNITEEQLREALLELAQADVIQILEMGEQFSLNDLKELELLRQYQARNPEKQSETLERLEKDREIKETLQLINDRFFVGQMSYPWAKFISDCFYGCAFEPPTVYALISEAASSRKLSSPNYAKKIAEAWVKAGVRSYADVQAYAETRERLQKFSRWVGRKLKCHMGEAETEMTSKWLRDYGYDKDVVSLALERSVQIADPNLNYFDAILRTWYKAGVKTRAEAEAYEERQKERQTELHRSALKPNTRNKRKSGSFGNFQERQYSDDYLQSFYEDPYALEKKLGLDGDAGDGCAQKGAGAAPEADMSGGTEGARGK